MPINKIKITNDPYEGRRPGYVSKYQELFDSLQIGQCLVLPEGASVQSVSGALAKHVKRNNLHATVRMRTQCEDGHARVWLLPKEMKLGTVWATPSGKPPAAKGKS